MMPEIFSKLFFVACLTLPYEVVALFKWNLSRLPFLWQAVNLHLLLCTGFYKMFLYTYPLFLLRDKWMIGRMTVRAAMSSGYASVCWWSWILISPWTLAVVLCCSCQGIARYKMIVNTVWCKLPGYFQYLKLFVVPFRSFAFSVFPWVPQAKNLRNPETKVCREDLPNLKLVI